MYSFYFWLDVPDFRVTFFPSPHGEILLDNLYNNTILHTIKKRGVWLNLFKAQLKKKNPNLSNYTVLLVFLAKNSHYLIYWTQSSETSSLHGTISQPTFYLHHVMDLNRKLFLDIKDGPKVPIFSNHYLNSWLMGSKLESCYF